MKQLIKVLTEQVNKQIEDKKTNLIRVEGIDNPVIYKGLCENIASMPRIDIFIVKMAKEKYQMFMKADKEEWIEALQYFYRGENSYYSSDRDEAYENKSYVDFDNAITKWRNESANFGVGQTALVLLLGTEAVPDTGGLADTSCVISPNELIAFLKRGYGEWFKEYLTEHSLGCEKGKKALNTLYKAVFSEINIDIFRFSDFIDHLDTVPISTMQDLIAYICETLNDIWGLPIIKAKAPNFQQLAGEKQASTEIVKKAARFITRAVDVPTERRIEAIKKKFIKYAEEKNIDVDCPYPEEDAVFVSFAEFQQCVVEFMQGKNIEPNRASLIKVDYSIIEEILGTRLKGKDVEEKDKSSTVSGEPVEAFSKIFLHAIEKFLLDNGEGETRYPTRIGLEVNEIKMSNRPKEQEEEAIRPLCYALGGILEFFNEMSIDSGQGLIRFGYQNSDGNETGDPFVLSNIANLKNSKWIKCSGKWGEPCRIQFHVIVSDEIGSGRYEYNWTFSPYSAWLHAFSYLGDIVDENESSYILPTMVVCQEIQTCFDCESEDEFYVQLEQLSKEGKFEEHRKAVHDYFRGTETSDQFDILCSDFKDFVEQMTQYGVFKALGRLRKVVEAYTTLMKNIHASYGTYTDIQKEKLPLLVNCFLISPNENIFQNGKMKAAILPAYNPVMLEQFDARQLFIRAGFEELLNACIEKRASKNFDKQIEKFAELSSITQGVDTIVLSGFESDSLVCKNMWGYFGVYCVSQKEESLYLGASGGGADIIDDDDASVLLKCTPMSKIIVRNVVDYINTFPARIDGLNLAFLMPTDMQHVVAALHEIVKNLDKEGTAATLNIRLICANGRKNSASYLRRWLDSYFKEEHSVKLNTFLSNLPSEKDAILDDLEKLLANMDLCFHYNVLNFKGIQFDKAKDEMIDKDEAKFPMAFMPDTISKTSGGGRRTNISQFQFLAAKWHTQASHVIREPNSQEGMYRAYCCLELTELQKQIIEKSHECCKWVVCIDPVVDRRMLEANHNKIIGFTTGEGSYGEMNVTVSARNDILSDIKTLLEKRIQDRFINWKPDRRQAAVKYCVEELSQIMDGSRILKALNPYDYEVHNYLAYALTVQMLGMKKEDNAYIVRTLISLDSYKHWFSDNEDKKRPDFMLLEIPKTEQNVSPKGKLHINIKLVECKMGYRNENQLQSAQKQLEAGLRDMCRNWNPANKEIKHRYWLNQLYRAIIFSPLFISNQESEYTIVRNKLYSILTNAVEISWSGDIYAFWLDLRSEKSSEKTLSSEIVRELSNSGIIVKDLVCHEYGQMFIQKMLLPPGYRDGEFDYNDRKEEGIDSLEEEEMGSGETIPKETDVYVPFLNYLCLEVEHTRKSCVAWYAEYFEISSLDQALKFESNGHAKWETVFDGVITKFRANGLLENSGVGAFHVTNFGRVVQEVIQTEERGNDFFACVKKAKEMMLRVNREVEMASDDKEKTMAGTSLSPCLRKKELKDVRLLLGTDFRTQEKYYWEFGNKELNNRHLLINGNSGCGKTYCIQTLLLEAALQGVSSVVFDYTGGFANSKLDPLFKETLGDRIQQRIVKLCKIPVNPFAKQAIQIDEDIFVPEEDADVADKIAEIFKSVYSLGDQQRSAVYSAVLNGLRSHGDNMSFMAMVEELENIGTSNAKSVISKIQAFTDYNLFTREEKFSWADIRDSEGTVYIIQLAGYGREIQVLLTEILLWDIWSFCVKNGDELKPFVLVLDEAQNLSHGEKSPSAKILTEGRKFGISGWYATQFMKPQLSDDEIQRLQQAGQKLYFCPPDDGIMTVAKNIDITVSGAKEWSERLKKLKKGECVTCGNMVRNGKWLKYDPRIIKVTSFEERCKND